MMDYEYMWKRYLVPRTTHYRAGCKAREHRSERRGRKSGLRAVKGARVWRNKPAKAPDTSNAGRAQLPAPPLIFLDVDIPLAPRERTVEIVWGMRTSFSDR